ncbi:MAG: hypothetical protein PHP98_02885 [Kiritimatiellae bacterium]|nr:hypothetical protein [Kiritimatiellia bacterium]
MPEKKIRLFLPAAVFMMAVCAAPFLPAQTAIESGQYFEDTLTTNTTSEKTAAYTFYANPGETVIIRLGHAEHDPYPDFALYNPNGTQTNCPPVSANEYHLSVITNGWTAAQPADNGWYTFTCTIPDGISNMTYNCSMLRTPNLPLSYDDPDVGNLTIGQSKTGKIDVSSDLDAGFFAVSNVPSTMQIRMGQKSVFLVPNIQIYAPDGTLVTNDFPTDYRSEITAELTNQGVYTVVCSDKFNAEGEYALTMIQIPGTISGTDTDIGTIISGEQKTGTINLPGDLDVAMFQAVSGDTVTITMRDIDADMIPVMEFYSPSGEMLARTTDVFETCAFISNAIASNGVYSIVCKDKEDRYNVSYTLEFNFMPGSPSLANIPEPPATVSASQGSYSNRIDITWSAAEGATGYDLWRSYGTNNAVQIHTNIMALAYSDYDVIPGTHYYYRVRSRNTYGASSNYSNAAEGWCGTSTVSANRRVLLVGLDNYSPSYGPSSLTTCTNDANGMRDIFFLGDPSNRWATTNITSYTDRQATKLTIQNALHSLAAASGAGDIVVYAHSSHGGSSGGTPGGANTFVCAYDANYTAAELADDLTVFNSETKIIVIIDACYSGGMYRLAGANPPPWRFAEETMENYRRIKAARLKSRGLKAPKELGQNIAFMTACNYDELSYTSDFYSRYIGYLIEGCNVQAVDTNNSGQLNFLELHNYAAEKSAAETPAQHAQTYHASLLENTIARALGTNAVVRTHIKYNDFDGDSCSDLAVYNIYNGNWRVGSIRRWCRLVWDISWGGPGYRPINGDYDGDRTSDCAVYNETLGLWKIASLSRWAVLIPSASFGGPTQRPVSGDYDGDKIYEGALCQSPESFWYIVTTAGTPLLWGESLTGMGFVPASGDYDGDRISDLAMYNTAMRYWYIMAMSGTEITWGTLWGVENAVPVSGDFDGDGCSDLAVYQESTGRWYIWSCKRSALIADGVPFGGPGYIPVPGDYDGDGVCDLVVYQESTGNWLLRAVNDNTSFIINLGGPGWAPVLPMW